MCCGDANENKTKTAKVVLAFLFSSCGEFAALLGVAAPSTGVAAYCAAAPSTGVAARVRSFTWRSSAAVLGAAAVLYLQKKARTQQLRRA